jgi:trk system potassium uptake protein TrkH
MNRRNAARSHLATLVGAYLVLPLAMTLPVLQVLPDTTLASAWFEMLSCFTTTGATGYDAERLPPSMHLWRAVTGWFGGFYILLAAYAVLFPLNLGGGEVISGRVPGRGATGATQITRIAEPAQRITRYAVAIFPVYAGLTLALWIVLLIAGRNRAGRAEPMRWARSRPRASRRGRGCRIGRSGLPGEMLMLRLPGLCADSPRACPGPGWPTATCRWPATRNCGSALLLVGLLPLVLFLRHWHLQPARSRRGSQPFAGAGPHDLGRDVHRRVVPDHHGLRKCWRGWR